MKAIVTVKFDDRKPEYDEFGRIQKVTGKCPLSLETGRTIFCSDVYGKHHSYVEEGENLEDIKKKAIQKFGHVTRIEGEM